MKSLESRKCRRIIRFLAANICMAGSSWGASVSIASSTSCTAQVTTVFDSKSCLLVDAVTGTGGEAEAVWTLWINGNEMSASAGAAAVANEDINWSGGASSSTIDASFFVTPAMGLSRMGWADIYAEVENRGMGTCEIDSGMFGRLDCSSPSDPFGQEFSARVPILLGPDAWGIAIHFSASANSIGNDSSGGGAVDVKLYEEDGITPAAMVPEPSTWIMLIVGILLFALFGGKRAACF